MDDKIRKGRKGLILFLIFGGLSLSMLAMGGLMILFRESGGTMDDGGIPLMKAIVDYAPYVFLILGGVLLIPAFINLVIWVGARSAMKEANDEVVHRERKIKSTSKRKAKIVLLIIAPLFIIFSPFLLMLALQGTTYVDQNASPDASPNMSFLTLFFVVLLIGVILLIVAINIKVRRHAHNRDIQRETKGDLVMITYPKKDQTWDLQKFMEIFQDAANDGYTDLVGYKDSVLTMRTPFQVEELQAQYERREKWNGGKTDIEMPEYFSPTPMIHNEDQSEIVETYTVPVDHYRIRLVKTGQKYKLWSDGTKTDVQDIYTKYYVYKGSSHDTYNRWRIRHFFFQNDSGAKVVGEDGEQLLVTEFTRELIDTKPFVKPELVGKEFKKIPPGPHQIDDD